MRRLLLGPAAAFIVAAPPSLAAPDARVEISPNARLVASVPITWDGDFTATAIAAEGDRLFVGSPGSGRAFTATEPRPGGFITYRLTEGPPYAKQVARFACPSSREGALSVWNGLVVQSVDPEDLLSNPQPSTDPACGEPALVASGGLRVVDVTDAARPRQVDLEPLVCGAKNHALVPSRGAAYVYTLKEACRESVASTDLGSTRLRVLKLRRTSGGSDIRLASQISLSAAVECHGWSVLMTAQRALCYGRSRLALFDIADPANPKLLGLGVVPGVTFQGAAFTPDGRRLITTSVAELDECSGPDDAVGVVRIFAVEDLATAGTGTPRTLTARSVFALPRRMTAEQPGGLACHSVAVSVIAGRTGTVFATVGWNAGGMTILDVTAEQPREVAHFASKLDTEAEPTAWSAIRRAVWYRGRIYAPEVVDRLGLRVLEVEGLGVADVAPQPRSYNPQTQGG